MKSDIILAGVGGQGILSIAASIGFAALKSNLYLKQSEVHGMSQRGGAVQSHLRLSDKEIYSDLIPYNSADLIISVEPLECLRYLPYLSRTGWCVTNITPFINIPDYPDVNLIISELNKIQNHVLINADQIAEQAGSAKASNMAILGAASPFINLPEQNFIAGITELFKKKGEKVVNINLAAFAKGREIASNHTS